VITGPGSVRYGHCEERKNKPLADDLPLRRIVGLQKDSAMRFVNKIIVGALIVLSVLLIAPREGWTLEPVTDAMLDKAESSAKEVIARAEAAGNSVVRALGEQALRVVEALREAVHSSIGDAKEAYLESQQKTFNNVNLVLDQLRDFEKVSLTDVTTLTATLSDEVSRLPFIGHAPAVMLYQPRVVVPRGAATVLVRVIGPKLAASGPTISFDGVDLPLHKARDVELVAQLDRGKLQFNEKEPRYQAVTIRFDQAETKWWKPRTWFRSDIIQRDMTLLLLPKTLGKFQIATKINSTNTEKKIIARHAGGHGKDAPMDIGIAPDPPDTAAGWQIDVDQVVADKGVKFSPQSGDDGASCVGLLMETLTPKGFSFRLQHGHKTDWAGHKSDVDVQCSMQVPLIKITPIVVDGEVVPLPETAS
jgi:hypothetical protein